MSDNPFAPRSHVENVANHLAWRRATHLTNVAEGAFLVVVPVVAALVLRHPAATTVAAILGLVGLVVLGIDRWWVGQVGRRPATREFAPVTPRGIASDALAWRALAIVAALLVAVGVWFIGFAGGSWVVWAVASVALLGQFAALTVPGLVTRPKKWQLLGDALRDPAFLTDLRAVGASYPQFARIPFTAPTDGLQLP